MGVRARLVRGRGLWGGIIMPIEGVGDRVLVFPKLQAPILGVGWRGK